MILFRTVFISMLLSACTCAPLLSQNTVDREYEIKSLFIYTFTRYIEWRDLKDDSAFVIGVLGDSKLIPFLEKISQTKTVDNKPIVIRRLDGFAGNEGCRILFVPKSREKNLSGIIKTAEDNSVLTIADTKGFAQKGVCINFVIVNDKIKFEINKNTMEQKKFKMSSKILELAILVE